MRWAALLQRVFEVDALRCPRCGATMRIISTIENPHVARRIPECMRLPARGPPLGEATGHTEEPAKLQDEEFFVRASRYRLALTNETPVSRRYTYARRPPPGLPGQPVATSAVPAA